MRLGIALLALVLLGAQQRTRVPVTGADRLFAQAALESNMAEIDMAKVAIARSDAPEVVNYAKKMLDEHGQMADAGDRILEAAAGMPVRLSAADELTLRTLRAMPAASFNQQYLMAQVGGHVNAMGVFDAETRGGSNAALVAFARRYKPTIQAHLELAVDTVKGIGGATPFGGGH